MSQAVKRQLAHVWDSSRCVNCGACIVACTMTNYVPLAYSGSKIKRGLATNIARSVDESAPLPKLALVQCQQCADAPCLARCPQKAISRNADGQVVTNEKKCVQCGRCVRACPYSARWTDPQTDIPKSCMGPGCRGLVAAGQAPACVQACPATAREFGNVLDPASAASRRIATPGMRRGGPDKGTKPNLYVLEKA